MDKHEISQAKADNSFQPDYPRDRYEPIMLLQDPLTADLYLNSVHQVDSSCPGTLSREGAILSSDDLASIRHVYMHPDVATFGIVTPEGVIIAAVSVIPIGPGRVALGNLLRLPETRGHGFGRIVLRDALQAILESRYPYSRVDLEVRRNNKHARELYARIGFLAVECEDPEFVDPEIECMSLPSRHAIQEAIDALEDQLHPER